MDTDAEYRAAVQAFYRVYEPLRDKYGLRMWSHTSVYDEGFIKINRYEGEKKEMLVCHVSEEDDTALYRKATEDLIFWKRRMEERQNGRNAANYIRAVDFMERGYQREA